MSYAVVIVNWNGAEDTLACLYSIFDGANDALAIVVDNGSADDSLARIAAGLASRGIAFERCAARSGRAPVPGTRVLLVAAGENLGFAAGCNLGLRAASAAGSEHVVFLNNDTVVEADALDLIVGRLAADPGCFATLPMLTVYGTDHIWNCGGEVSPLGLRRYHLAGRPRAQGAARGEIRCSFFTGCCFAVSVAAFRARGGFSERFFFGEEDFELALWMREHGLASVCVTAAVVQHKVSASFDSAAGGRAAARVFIYYLNRFIHMRLRFGLARWCLWSAAYLPYVAVLLWRSGAVPAAGVPSFLCRLLSRARAMDRVTRSDFEAVMAGRA
ncbi:putative Glycosyltransferase family 2 protein [Rubrivivax sp. A210]|uniref:glycosyltransferase n=1 Tax=Rubrivivax sp. A210 TaxID=2772301 RepID=UPI00191847DE|nr:glycosyltransferase family 2 protein [Rubrivivax sp. A210]CAD5372640.1 putative Glycosyltransferase family 2 protein [Rubrivivax sp. A210]